LVSTSSQYNLYNTAKVLAIPPSRDPWSEELLKDGWVEHYEVANPMASYGNPKPKKGELCCYRGRPISWEAGDLDYLHMHLFPDGKIINRENHGHSMPGVAATEDDIKRLKVFLLKAI
jgi:hypothetical protein